MVSLPPDFMAKVVGRLAEARGDSLSEIYPTSAGVDFFAIAKESCYIVINEAWRFDATAILALLTKVPSVERVICIYLGKKLTRPKLEVEDNLDTGVSDSLAASTKLTSLGRIDPPAERRPLLASALAAQLSAFGIGSTFLELLGSDDVREVPLAITPLKVFTSATTLDDLRKPTHELGIDIEPYKSELRSRFGDLFLEVDGVPYAKVLGNGEILTGSSFAESEFLELSHEGRALESLLSNLRVSLMKCRGDKRYYEISTSMWSRSLIDRVLSGGISISRPYAYEIDSTVNFELDATAFRLGDYYRSGYVGIDPFGDLKKATSGFYGQSGDPFTFALRRGDGGIDLLFASMSLDISVPVKVGEIVESIRGQMGAVRGVSLIATTGLLKFERIRELLSRLNFPIRILAIDGEWRSKQDIGVVDVGVY